MQVRTREYRLYRFFDGGGDLLYIGQTGRLPWKRLLEHVCEQPWADEMARWEVDPGVWWSEAEVLTAERHAIESEWPRYNVEHNGRNPHRVYAGAPRRAVGRRTGSRVARGSVPWWWRMLWHPGFWFVVAWLVLAAGLWWAAGQALSARDGAMVGAVGASIIMGAAVRERRRRDRRRRRRW